MNSFTGILPIVIGTTKNSTMKLIYTLLFGNAESIIPSLYLEKIEIMRLN
jgi:hypothetical protein